MELGYYIDKLLSKIIRYIDQTKGLAEVIKKARVPSFFIDMQPSFEEAYNNLYKGWGRAEAQADYNAGGWRNKAGVERYTNSYSSGGNTYVDPVAEAKRINEYNIQQNQPAIANLQAQKEPLKQRYEALLQDVTKKTEIATAREFGRRGISTESGLYDTTLAEKIAPEAKSLGLSREQDLLSLEKAIAQLQAGDPMGAVSLALQLNNAQTQADQFAKTYELQKQAANTANTEVVVAGGRKLLINKNNGEVISDLGSSSEGGGSSSGFDPVTQQLLTSLLGGSAGQGSSGSDWEDVTPSSTPSTSSTSSGKKGGFGNYYNYA